MSKRRRGVMSKELRYELAKELGVADIVKREGFGAVSSRDCGNLVRLAIQRAEGSLKRQ
ncbi:MAG: small, acid-soluble spore protein, alpha/beta type [Firmicutes bacterium]|nr:small, acid-soluble spore protein, alpha/beta type [Bacillota bacterium]